MDGWIDDGLSSACMSMSMDACMMGGWMGLSLCLFVCMDGWVGGSVDMYLSVCVCRSRDRWIMDGWMDSLNVLCTWMAMAK